MKYFLISCSEDGDVSVETYKKDELLRAIKEDFGHVEFMERLDERDPQYWGRKVLIVQGEIVTPKPKKVVEEYEI